MEILTVIAALCAVHSGDAESAIREQLECQRELLQCIQEVDFEFNKQHGRFPSDETALKACVAENYQ